MGAMCFQSFAKKATAFLNDEANADVSPPAFTADRADEAIDCSRSFDEERKGAQLFPALSVSRVTAGTDTKCTKRHKEIVNELLASSINTKKSNVSLFEDACKIFEREGLAPMPSRTICTYIHRARDEMTPPAAVNSVVSARGKINLYSGRCLDTIISEVVHREERREDGKKRMYSKFVKEAIRNEFGEEAKAMARSTFYSKVKRVQERGYLKEIYYLHSASCFILFLLNFSHRDGLKFKFAHIKSMSLIRYCIEIVLTGLFGCLFSCSTAMQQQQVIVYFVITFFCNWCKSSSEADDFFTGIDWSADWPEYSDISTANSHVYEGYVEGIIDKLISENPSYTLDHCFQRTLPTLRAKGLKPIRRTRFSFLFVQVKRKKLSAEG